MNALPAGTCQAYMPELNARCGEPGVPVRRGCVHEHVLDAYACEWHIALATTGYCLTCFETDGHDCPIVLERIAEVSS